MHLFAPFIAHLESLVSSGGYFIIFITSVLEGIPLIGSAIPGHTVIILAGFLAKIGTLSLIPVLIVGAGGAIIGDAIAFMLGAKYGYGFLEKTARYLNIKPEHLEKAKAVIAKHTGKAIIMGRFSPITRPLTPFLVGASGTHINKFWLYDIIGSLTWAVSSIAIGYIFGVGYQNAAGFFGKFVLAGLIIAVLLVWAYHFINTRWHIFAKYDILSLGAVFISLFVLFKTIQDTVVTHSFMSAIDVAVNFWISAHINETVVSIMKFVTTVLSPLSICLVAAGFAIWYMVRRKLDLAAFLTLSFAGVLMWVGFIKELTMRFRPIDALVLYSDYSFPSLHAAMAGFACMALIYLFISHIKKIMPREIAIVGIVILSALVCFSRIYLGVHWMSDVVAGYALGICWTALMYLFVKYVAVLVKWK
jgi:undecaprenyl-diphosphatase